MSRNVYYIRIHYVYRYGFVIEINFIRKNIKIDD